MSVRKMSVRKTKKEAPSTNLLELNEELVELFEELAQFEAAGVQPPDDLLGRISMCFGREKLKVDRTVGFIKAAEAKAARAKEIAEWYRTKAAVYENAAKRTKAWVMVVLDTSKQARLDGDMHSLLKVRNSQPTLIFVDGDETNVPDEYLEQQVSWRVRKADLKKAVAAGAEVPNVQIRQDFHIRCN